MNIKPIGDRVLIKTLKAEEVTASGFVLPESATNDKKEQGEVIALGTGEEVTKSGLKVGQTIIFGGWPKEIKDDKTKEIFKIVEFGVVLAILE
jgi:chaperonin GroES